MWAFRNSQLDNVQRISLHGGSAINGTSCPLPTRIREHCGRKGTKIVRAKGQGRLDGNNVFWTCQDQCANELQLLPVEQLCKIKPTSIPAWSAGGWSLATPVEKLMIVDGF